MEKYGSCQYCGKIDRLMNGLCNDCYSEELNNINDIKTFLSKYPHSNAMDIALETGISIDKITRLIKKGTIR
ncbi:hypothetical protein FH966_02640 [Lentibacillus cibarius]|uniref:Uncharacterized protein n=1 Tax=Lentibacillus cibarius TaxID=2583219 RepID=A0A549YFN3_9BACI|nr:hypothetical protein [Lentibacillus cibarius]TRM10699.1 hypothetical protein FH966_02640 [Lentibacillus cibarius]